MSWKPMLKYIIINILGILNNNPWCKKKNVPSYDRLIVFCLFNSQNEREKTYYNGVITITSLFSVYFYEVNLKVQLRSWATAKN